MEKGRGGAGGAGKGRGKWLSCDSGILAHSLECGHFIKGRL